MAAQSERRLIAVMFTDMVGYTALMQSDEKTAVERRDRYVSALDREHDAAGGTVVQRLGDGSLSMFPSALAAVQAAVAMQHEFAAAGIPVRIGIHVGEVLIETERLTGDAVNIAARVESFAVPGSVFLSDTAYDQVKNQIALQIAPLGSFQSRTSAAPVDLYAVAGDGLVVPDRSELEGKGEAIVAIRSPLPEPSTGLLGRERELSDLAGLVRANRVVTMTGPGGVGKTRLATEVAHTLAPSGAAFAGFADVADSRGFLAALAAALDVKEAEERSFADGIVSLIGGAQGAALPRQPRADRRWRRILRSSCGARSCGSSSRAGVPLDRRRASDASIRFRRRRRRAVHRAPRPRARALRRLATPSRSAGASTRGFQLAAARVRLLGPQGLRDRLDHALELLTTGDSHERQQTLRATIDWSYSLLDPPAQEAFRRLAVFAGGCTLADAEAVAGDGTLDELEALIDAALVVQADGRLRMLQTSPTSRVSSSMRRERSPMSQRATRAGTPPSRGRSATASRAPSRSPRSRAGSSKTTISKLRSTRSSRRRAAPTRGRSSWGSRCRATCGCTGTSAARTSPRATTRRRSSSWEPAARRARAVPAL